MVSFRLLLIRHALAYESELWDGGDLTRPLLPRGKKQAKQTGRRIDEYLRREKRQLDMIFVSEAKRSIETAQQMLKLLPDIQYSKTSLINPGSGVDGYLKLISESQEDGNIFIAIVGHEYDLSDTVAELCGRSNIRWKKGGFLTLCLRNKKWFIEIV